mmetsp:Transcript_107780/g.303680  ORF Transcript_107780/g.303680 Transcript_107780/m.303680 type:complete len:416 (-) Transcript_107780:149-1396(-)
MPHQGPRNHVALACLCMCASVAAASVRRESQRHVELKDSPATVSRASAECLAAVRASMPRQYVAYKTDALNFDALDADLSKPAWAEVPWTEDFVDIATDVRPQHQTRAKIRWDDDFLYVAAELVEPHVWATLTQHDSVIFNDNDFEIFLDPAGSTHDYTEFELNAFNTTWDLRLNKPYGDSGVENSRRVDPKGFEMPRLRSAVQVDGTINDPSSPSRAWRVEVAIPLADVDNRVGQARGQAPKVGDTWRINFSRVQWVLTVTPSGEYVKTPSCQSCAKPGSPSEDNWVWSPQGQVAMHLPERWGILHFAEGAVKAPQSPSFAEWPSRAIAAGAYYAEHAYAKAHGGSFTADPSELVAYAADAAPFPVCPECLKIRLGDDGGSNSFHATAYAADGGLACTVRQDRLMTMGPESDVL